MIKMILWLGQLLLEQALPHATMASLKINKIYMYFGTNGNGLSKMEF